MTDTTPVLAWHGDPALKADAVARMRAHAEADRFLQGDYLTSDDDGKWRGCFHGCLTAEVLAAEQGVNVADARTLDYWQEAERLFGIPVALGTLLDDAFENAAPGDAPVWAVEVTEAIPVGADLAGVADELYAEGTHEDHGRIVELLKAAPVPARTEG